LIEISVIFSPLKTSLLYQKNCRVKPDDYILFPGYRFYPHCSI